MIDPVNLTSHLGFPGERKGNGAFDFNTALPRDLTKRAKNVAKCLLCSDVIESLAEQDYVECSCGEIGISGGGIRFEAFARDFKHFARLDEKGVEMGVKYQEHPEEKKEVRDHFYSDRVTKGEKLDAIKALRKSYESLPPHAYHSPVSHADFYSLLLILESLFVCDWNSSTDLTNLSSKV